MNFHCYIYAPHGIALRRLAEKTCEVVKAANVLWISSALNTFDNLPPDEVVPRCCKAAGLVYSPPRGAEKGTPDQDFVGAPYIFKRGRVSCGDAAAYDAACLEVLYGIEARCQIVPQGETSYHANVLTEFGVYDPTGFNNWTDPNYELPPLSLTIEERKRRIERLCCV